MILTEAEARQKWCPESRGLDWQRMDQESGILAFAAVNRDHGAHDDDGNETVVILGRYRCIASGCMFWRWHDPLSTETHTYHRAELGDPISPTIKASPASERRGYCGKAGKP